MGGRGVALLVAESGNVQLLAALLERGLATLTECAEDGSTPLLSAVSGNSVEMVHWLLSGPQGAEVVPSLLERDQRGADCILTAAEAGSPAMLRELLRRGAASDVTDDSGCGVLHYAAAGGHVAAVEFCVRALHVPCGVQDSDGDTPLLIAAHEGHVAVVDWLLKNGSSLSERNHEGISAALAAAAGERGEVLTLLARRGGGGGGDMWAEELSRHPELILNFVERGATSDAGGNAAPMED